MERSELKPIIEALIFVSEEPMTLDLMTMVFEEQGVSRKEIKEAIAEIVSDFGENSERGIQVAEIAGGYQVRSKPAMADWIKKLNVPKPVRLSQAAMETLAIVAYRQPLMRSGLEEIRGVDSGGVLKTLLERGLVRIVGKSDDPGNPLLYATTKAFLEMFSLNSLKELPTLREIEELEVQDRVGEFGRDEVSKQEIREGIEEVVGEYKEDIAEYSHDPEKLAEDSKSIHDLEMSIKNLRSMEKEIFPKPKEEIQVVDKETGEVVQGMNPEEGAQTQDETPPPQNTGSGD
jgi:segregation and condensation protein B